MQVNERLPLWVVCNGLDRNKTLLLAALTYKGHFDRGCLNYLVFYLFNSSLSMFLTSISLYISFCRKQ